MKKELKNVQQKWLVFGGDGLIGRRLADSSAYTSAKIIRTTRRKTYHKELLFADLSNGNISEVLSVDADVVFLCAAVTSIRECNENPEKAFKVNVTGTVQLASELIKRGAFVIFLSSNAVFNGSEYKPYEYAPRSPVTEYGIHKAGAEEGLISLPGATDHLAIVRITKVLSSRQGVPAKFLQLLGDGKNCPAFHDLKLSPISMAYIHHGLIVIAKKKIPGIFHFSGEDELSYAELACKLATAKNLDQKLVKPISSNSNLADVLFRPKHPALGMQHTKKVLGIFPQPIEQLLLYLIKKR